MREKLTKNACISRANIYVHIKTMEFENNKIIHMKHYSNCGSLNSFITGFRTPVEKNLVQDNFQANLGSILL